MIDLRLIRNQRFFLIYNILKKYFYFSRKSWPRSLDCPPNQKIQDYCDYKLNKQENDKIAAHIEQCERCFMMVIHLMEKK